MIRLTTLGSVRVHRDTSEVPDLPAQRLRFALLLYLAAEQDVSRDEVVQMFWPDRDTSRGKHALRQMLYELRNGLGGDWLELRRDRIVCRIELDAADFERAAADGRTADALRLYGGPFLPGFVLDSGAFEGWVERRRGHLGRMHRRLQREHIAQLAEQGRPDHALASARQWVELDPLDDEAAHTLIEQLALSGQRTAALQHFESYEKQLAAELQVEPLDETLRLVASIRSGEQPSEVTLASFTQRGPAAAANAEEIAPLAVARAGSAVVARAPVRRRIAAMLRRPPVRRTAIALLILAISVSVAVVMNPRGSRPVPANRTLRIAVLPLHDHSPDSSLRAIANELTEQLTASLRQSRVIEVVSSDGVNPGAGLSADSVGRMLGADYLVGGSVRQEADRVQLSLALHDGRNGSVVRNRSMERTWSQAQNLVDDVVTSAATFLRSELGTQLEVQRVQAAASSRRSWQLLLDGKDLVNQTVTLVRATQYDVAGRTLDRADSLFATAQDIDSKWAEPLIQRAWVRHRRALLLRHFLEGDPSTIDSCLHEAIALADGAISRRPNDASAHEVRGVLFKQLASEDVPADSADRLLASAEESLQRAVQLEPQRQSALRHLAELLHLAERYGEARIAAAEALRADPYANANTLINQLFQSSFEAWEDEQADSWCMTGRARFKDQAPFMWCLLAMHAWGNVPAEPAKLRQDLANAPPIMFRAQRELAHKFDAMLAAAFARAGEPDSARAILRRLERIDDGDLVWLRAAAHVQLDEPSVAIELLRTLPPTRVNLRVMRQRPFWKLRGNTDFERMIQSRPL